MKYGNRFCESRPGNPKAAGKLAMFIDAGLISGDKIRSILNGSAAVAVELFLLGELGGELISLMSLVVCVIVRVLLCSCYALSRYPSVAISIINSESTLY